MFRKLPPEFNASWYVATYPDAALSGLSPKEHYLRFGRLMGRKPAPPPKVTKPQTAGASTDNIGVTDGTQIPSTAADPFVRPNPIISRPADFDAAAVVPVVPTSKTGSAAEAVSGMESLAMGAFASTEECGKIGAPLIAFARLMGLELPSDLNDPNGPVHCASQKFRAGETRLENAWFASESKLRIRIAGGADPASRSQGWTLRVWQFDDEAPGGLSPAGPGVQFPVFGPIFHDIELNHPLMPLLMELSNREGNTRGLALLPFPSLLPGGMHGAELNVLQSESNPMDAFWSLSDKLLKEFFGQEGWSDRSIAALSTFADEFVTSETLTAELQHWLSRLFGFTARASTMSQRNDASSGLELRLPQNCLPTVSALVSRQLALDGASALTGPLLVAEYPSFRPRWSVIRPADHDSDASFPILRQAAVSSKGESVSRTVPVHLAIALRSADLPIDALPASERAPIDNAQAPEVAPITVVLDASDRNHTERLLNSIHAASKGDIELVVRMPEHDGELRDAISQIWGSDDWKAVPADADLRDLASSARHEALLTVNDRLTSIDPFVLAALRSIVQDDDDIASASCVLLAELIIKRETVVQPATGGLFPAGVSFARAPCLVFSEPDVRQALPEMTYPVAANTLHLTVWRRSALAGLPRPRGPVPSTAEDIRIGLDLLEAGYRNVCTSRVTARFTGSYARRDTIDPVGASHMNPSQWQDILGRVTLLRELF